MTLTMNVKQCTLLIIDLQTRLLPAIHSQQQVLTNTSKLLRCAKLLDVPSVLTEQIPDRLGNTTEEILALHAGPIFIKSTFSAANDPELLRSFEARPDVVITGTEAHVCVLQTALDLLARGYTVWVVNDACGSRTQDNKRAALARMQNAGATVVTTEMVLFEWLAHAEHPKFREALALIK